MWQLGPGWKDEEELATRWRDAQPFPYLVFDDFVPAGSLLELLATLDEEPVDLYEADIYRFEASAPEPRTEGLRALRDSFAETVAAPLGRITGKTVRRADLRAYAYRAGHYLLPHSDHQEGVGRALAFAYYVPSPEPPSGGELELFACSAAEVSSVRVLEPRANRLVVFDVGDVTLHQVREVTNGLRVSLSGWLYP